MTATVLVEFWGGFHAQMRRVTVRLNRATCDSGNPFDALHDRPRAEARVLKHICGIKACMCGLHHGVKWEVQ
ncbi:hypothetical protein UFOVP501_3 [uncultured Caudovirales phage]|uniref:Uncharacterized protein n=1 Tax=uncultured Caudovirales phage TaxID=2100421 RepID=A0A6J5P1I3_9CAUD|nr:hypothetical protein UFOVP501_3 [uncultured Caudovirales phage]CAB4161384.1 hypothetical protein UFOVP762_48 [uncultured Caudovirales phage]CAB4187134.1 hypothetical protein UFOVP1161_3 [uncultured Caudovirales phage]